MAKIKSTVPLVYNSRKQTSGIIVVEISEWKYELKNNRYVAVVSDYLSEMKYVEGQPEPMEQLTFLRSKNVFYPKEQIDALFFALNNPITGSESYSAEMDNLISMALLYVTQQDPIYGSMAENWELE